MKMYVVMMMMIHCHGHELFSCFVWYYISIFYL